MTRRDVPGQAQVERIFAEAAHLAPGISYGIVRRGEVLHSAGLGTLAVGSRRDVDSGSVFRIASMSKSFTAASILRLAEDGALTLDDPVEQFVPSLRLLGLPTGAPALTIRHCLTMSAGLPTDDQWADRLESMQTGELVALLSGGIRAIAAPGTQFEYSNLGFALLGQVVETASAMTFGDYVSTRLLRPLDMNSTTLDYGEVSDARLARGHRRGADGWEEQPFSSAGAFSAIGGLLSSVEDIARWVGFLARPIDETGQGTPLTIATRAAMQQCHRVIPTRPVFDPERSCWPDELGAVRGYGLGLFVDHQPRWGTVIHHSGGYPGFGSHMRWHPASEWGIVAFGNAQYCPLGPVAEAALGEILSAAEDLGTPITAWDASAAGRAAVEAVVRHEDDAHGAGVFAPNLLLDTPASERLALIDDALAIVGPPLDGEGDVVALTPARMEWSVPALRGHLLLDLSLTPTDPPQVQTYAVRAVPAPSADMTAAIEELRAGLATEPRPAIPSCIAPDAATDRLMHWRALLGPLRVGEVDAGSSPDDVEVEVSSGSLRFAIALSRDPEAGSVHLDLRPRAGIAISTGTGAGIAVQRSGHESTAAREVVHPEIGRTLKAADRARSAAR